VRAGGLDGSEVQQQLGDIISFVKVIDEVDTEGAEPMWSPLEAGGCRETPIALVECTESRVAYAMGHCLNHTAHRLRVTT
jgi:Asp-tRNA(Asn)/Glu-tRNA(Gln) amidotransferase C subunit